MYLFIYCLYYMILSRPTATCRENETDNQPPTPGGPGDTASIDFPDPPPVCPRMIGGSTARSPSPPARAPKAKPPRRARPPTPASPSPRHQMKPKQPLPQKMKHPPRVPRSFRPTQHPTLFHRFIAFPRDTTRFHTTPQSPTAFYSILYHFIAFL